MVLPQVDWGAWVQQRRQQLQEFGTWLKAELKELQDRPYDNRPGKGTTYLRQQYLRRDGGEVTALARAE